MKIDRCLFGAGIIGKNVFDLFMGLGIRPGYFIDNSKDKQKHVYCGLTVISLSDALLLPNTEILIACKNVDEIRCQLLASGVTEEKIWDVSTLKGQITYLQKCLPDIGIIKNTPDKKTVIFDLSNGLVLGGVETWSIDMASKLCREGYKTLLLTNDLFKQQVDFAKNEVIELPFASMDSLGQQIAAGVKVIYSHIPCIVVGNFVGPNIMAAYVAKKVYMRDLRLITVIHNDEKVYYDSYTEFADLIDKCIVISAKMRDTLLQMGFPKEKICMLQWEIPCIDCMSRSYSPKETPIKIGYAGRVTVRQKRMDILFEVALELKKQGCDFILEIAGDGDYSGELNKRLRKEGLDDMVKLLGYLEHDKIAEFWRKQDIMISCSDYEGHSISQAEAMASGAVPVITDVSGAKDDVKDGINGFVVGIGQVEEIVKHIMYLSNDRVELAQMGMCAYQTVKKRSVHKKQFERLIEDLWQEN